MVNMCRHFSHNHYFVYNSSGTRFLWRIEVLINSIFNFLVYCTVPLSESMPTSCKGRLLWAYVAYWCANLYAIITNHEILGCGIDIPHRLWVRLPGGIRARARNNGETNLAPLSVVLHLPYIRVFPSLSLQLSCILCLSILLVWLPPCIQDINSPHII